MIKSILLVEDTASDEKLTLLAFKTCGVAHEVAVVRDGAAALDYLFATGAYTNRNAGVPPALVLLDLKLPKIDGLEVLRRIRADQRTSMLPVVVLTASREDEDVLQSYTRGANAYLRKPVEFSEFSQALKALVSFWLVFNEPPPVVRRGTP